MLRLWKFLPTILLLSINSQAQKEDTINNISVVHNVDLENKINRTFVDSNYVPRKSVTRDHNQIMLQNPSPSFLGEFNGTFWFVVRNRADQDTARLGCRSMGMRLASFASQEELDFILSVYNPDDGLAWTDGSSERHPDIFRWEEENAHLYSGAPILHWDRLGMVIDKSEWSNGLMTLVSLERNYYLCALSKGSTKK